VSSRWTATSSSASAPSVAGRTRLAVAIATAGGVGRAPVAPGTAASGLTVAVLWLLAPSPLVLAALLVAVLVLGTWAAGEAERALSRGKDPGVIVVDEVAGMTLSVLAVPLTPAAVVTGFLLFRVLDVLKPFPANVSQRLPGGVGVMADDLVAGLYALGLLVVARQAGWL
jgi:phosphatidylglycerophosphatase A